MKQSSHQTPKQTQSPVEKMKEGFNKGVAEGRRAFLKKLLAARGVDVPEIQKLYSSGLMEPDILEDITLGDLVKVSGIGIGMARRIKEIILREEMSLPPEYEKVEIKKVKKEAEAVLEEIEQEKAEIEMADREYNSIKTAITSELKKRNELMQEVEKLRAREKEGYFGEKRIQDEVMFVINEQNALQTEVDDCAVQLERSKKGLEQSKREFLFTKGECEYLLEKINYLITRLDTAILEKGNSSNRLSSFMDELRRVHDKLADTYKNSQRSYYTGKAQEAH